MNLGMPEMLFIGLLALLIFGPRKLPEIGRQLGRGMNEFKRATGGLKEQLDQEMRALEAGPQVVAPVGSGAVAIQSADASVIERTTSLLSRGDIPASTQVEAMKAAE